MTFSITRPPSPSRERDRDRDAQNEVDQLASAVHAALQAQGYNHNHPPEYDMPASLPPATKEKEKTHGHHHHSSLEIVVNSDTLCLRGTGVDVEPALLSGNVVLHLTEPMAIREITLAFRGKARLPSPANEPLTLNSSALTYLVCSHEWSFLEGEKKHSHTLKAGRHLFPFQLEVGGSLPSTLYTSILGGASVAYKLRATAVRPGLSHNLQCMLPITIMRGFASEALEYQQTLEIENTWPEKLMYSIMIPHKAWAAGDKLTAVVKFSPLAKGAKVLNVNTTINETVKLYLRSGCQENTRVIATTRHDIVNGKAVCVEEHHHRIRTPLAGPPVSSSNGTTTNLRGSRSVPATPYHHPQPGEGGGGGGYFNFNPNQPSASTSSTSSHSSNPPSPPNEPGPSTLTPSASASASMSSASSTSQHSPHIVATAGGLTDPALPPDLELSQDDVITILSITIPACSTPTHTLEPIILNHRVRWSILIGNLDGHTSELRCSLPLHILDHHLLEEARSATMATRRLLLGNNVELEGVGEEEEEVELPSYPAHVRDRVANVFFDVGSVGGTSGARTPYAGSSGIASPVNERDLGGGWFAGASTGGSSSVVTPNHNAQQGQQPQTNGNGIVPLDWVNAELLQSLQQQQPPQPQRQATTASASTTTITTTASSQTHASNSNSPPDSNGPSRPASRWGSRRPSRAPSPERHLNNNNPVSSTSVVGVGGGHETYVHSSTASRNAHGLFHISMKPFTSLTSTFSSLGGGVRHPPLTHSNAPGNSNGTGATGGGAAAAAAQRHAHSSSDLAGFGRAHGFGLGGLHAGGGGAGAGGGTHPFPTSLAVTPVSQIADPMSQPSLLHRAFTEVPDYEVASQNGGGLPPLSTLRGLPSYEEAESQGAGAGRVASDTDLAGRFRGAGGVRFEIGVGGES